MTKSAEIERWLEMHQPALCGLLIGYWLRSPGPHDWTEFAGLVENSRALRRRIIGLPPSSSPAIGIARDLCLAVEARASAKAILSEMQR